MALFHPFAIEREYCPSCVAATKRYNGHIIIKSLLAGTICLPFIYVYKNSILAVIYLNKQVLKQTMSNTSFFLLKTFFIILFIFNDINILTYSLYI